MAAFAGKRFIVTGAASGIGRAVVHRLLHAGAETVGFDVTDADGVTSQLDISEPDQVRDAVACAASAGPLNGVVNAAGIAGFGAIGDVDLDRWNRVLAVNLTGAMLVARAAVPYLVKAGGGAIVNVASIYGMIGGTNNIPYNVSKGGLLQLTRSMAADLATANIRVNAVSPGYIETPMSSVLNQNMQMRDAFVAMHLLKRSGRPEDVAAAIAFLLSDDAAFITGVNLPVDGGFTAAAIIPGYAEARADG